MHSVLFLQVEREGLEKDGFTSKPTPVPSAGPFRAGFCAPRGQMPSHGAGVTVPGLQLQGPRYPVHSWALDTGPGLHCRAGGIPELERCPALQSGMNPELERCPGQVSAGTKHRAWASSLLVQVSPHYQPAVCYLPGPPSTLGALPVEWGDGSAWHPSRDSCAANELRTEAGRC